MKIFTNVILLFLFFNKISAQTVISPDSLQEAYKKVRTGAERTELYAHYLMKKKIAVVANQTSMIDKTHLVDSLISLGVKIKCVFTPEHGFRGIADAGEHILNELDDKTGLPIISLYGENYKPSSADLEGIDIIIFDIQDVGVRFYTYITTMHYVMESCAENKIEFLILDRPNPNGFYIDGPVLVKELKSFVGLHPVPIVHGMTLAEYAKMINEEFWLKDSLQCSLKYILCQGYDHSTFYQLPIKPSPNLPNMLAIYLYPSLCLFEGTNVSVGRGTDKPFQMLGSPGFLIKKFNFIPQSTQGAKHPLYEGKTCYGTDLSTIDPIMFRNEKKINLEWLMVFYNNTRNKRKFFNSFFYNLSGTYKLKEQIINAVNIDTIRASWQQELVEFKKIRKKYLLYPDFTE